MTIKIIKDKISAEVVKELAQDSYGTMIKGVVDIRRRMREIIDRLVG